MKSVRPETVSQNHDAGSLGTVVLRSDKAADTGMKPHHVKISAADNPALNGTRAHRGRSW